MLIVRPARSYTELYASLHYEHARGAELSGTNEDKVGNERRSAAFAPEGREPTWRRN